MFSLPQLDYSQRESFYDDLRLAAMGLVAGEKQLIANCANLSALIYHSLPDVNWAGFYLMDDGELVVGPFQGKPACVRIRLGEGVCGTAAERRESLVVDDVDAFPGHIACDSASQSEIVIPLVRDGRLLGVLDIDSPHRARFDEQDRQGLEALITVLD
ncbi:GAF domain-containing protein [Gammaproteobacteria bacterium AB-CW1]|uniref:GAF domain-containing protein n=1 Tax=Natronospira elongata TaxID=3110268 RepID=A0AAP6JDI7_9GAMM|nr:GAF domain-containing protein [Gammaproteobacteria bacterium AB-CW1]